MHAYTIGTAFLLAQSALAEPAAAADSIGAVVVDQVEGEERLSATVTFSNNLGLGTFVRNDFSDQPYYGQSLSLRPSYKLTDLISTSARWSLAWELTTPDNSTGRRYSPSDVVLGIAHNKLYEDERYTGIGISGSATLDLPTSFTSRFRGTITNIGLGVGAKRAFLGDKLTLSYGFRFKKFLPRQRTPGFLSDPEEQEEIRDEQGNLLVSCSASRDLCAGTSGFNPSYAISNSLALGYELTDKLSAEISLAMSNTFKFGPPGEFTDPNLPSRGRSDTTAGDIGLSYAHNDTFSFSAGIASEQPALNSRNTGLRFPFFDFSSPSNNFTQLYLSASATL